jgi:hypothetical protein
VSFDRRYSAEWWWVNEEEACALRERQDREAAAQAAEALENQRWNDVPCGTMDEVSSFGRLDLPFL